MNSIPSRPIINGYQNLRDTKNRPTQLQIKYNHPPSVIFQSKNLYIPIQPHNTTCKETISGIGD